MPDFVGELLGSRDYADLANRLYRLGDGLRAKLVSEPVKKTPSNTALIFFFGRCFKTYQASIELLRLGFWQDAAVLARTLREGEYQVGWIMEGGNDTAQLFFQDYTRNKRNIMRTLAEHGDPEIKVFPPKARWNRCDSRKQTWDVRRKPATCRGRDIQHLCSLHRYLRRFRSADGIRIRRGPQRDKRTNQGAIRLSQELSDFVVAALIAAHERG